MKRSLVALAALAAVILGAGLARLEVEADVFSLLPARVPMLEALKQFQQSFGSSRELILALRAEDAGTALAAAEELAAELEGAGLAEKVVWRNPLRGSPAEIGELVAYLWLNQPPPAFGELEGRLEPERLRPAVEAALDRLATSLRPQEVARLSRDPFGLTSVAERVALPSALGGADPFASADGRFRVLFVPFDGEAGFWGYRGWVRSLRRVATEWRGSFAGGPIELQATGQPAFLVEAGSGLLRDIRGAAIGTLVVVAALFWLAHRSWRPLVWLVVLLLLVLALTIGVGALVLGTLNAVALGFAAILLGLAADYGLILYQERAVHPERSAAEHRAVVAPSIVWAALTTAGAFLMIGRSSLPGVNQLGTLVAAGILIAAVVMLVAFLPPLAKAPRRAPAPLAAGRHRSPAGRWAATLAVVALAALALGRGLPAVDLGTQDLGPRDSPAGVALRELQRELGGYDEALWVLVPGDDEAQVAERLRAAERLLAAARDEGVLDGYSLPAALWPDPAAQQANRATARAVAARLSAARRAALEGGFTPDSLALTEQTFDAWSRYAARDGVVRPESPGARWVFRRFAGNDGGRPLALGSLRPAPEVAVERLLELADGLEEESGARLFGWPLVSRSLLGFIGEDLRRSLLPMAAALVLLLALAFRRPGEVALSLISVGLSLVCLLALMALFGWSWNLLNIMALPLLVGAGVDYSIHLQLALRRYGGDLARVQASVGRAILLCGASTAAGFGTLGLASNAGLASLGRVCATGLVVSTLISVYLLPAWWRALPAARRRGGS